MLGYAITKKENTLKGRKPIKASVAKHVENEYEFNREYGIIHYKNGKEEEIIFDKKQTYKDRVELIKIKEVKSARTSDYRKKPSPVYETVKELDYSEIKRIEVVERRRGTKSYERIKKVRKPVNSIGKDEQVIKVHDEVR